MQPYISYLIQIFLGCIMIAGIYFAGKRLISTHEFQERNILSNFKTEVKAEVAYLKGVALDRDDLEGHRKENNTTFDRAFDDIKETNATVTLLAKEINSGITAIKVSMAHLTGAFEEYKRNSEKDG